MTSNKNASPIPPHGIKYKDWARKKHGGHAPSHAYGRAFGEQTCSKGHITRSTLGSRPHTICPACREPFAINGYVRPR